LNRKLLILDVVLGACVIYGGLQLHSHWTAAKARQATIPVAAPNAAPPPPIAPLPQEPAVLPSGFKDVALKTLFDPSRNPDVIKPAPPPPPPPPVPPALPSFHGMMDFGDGPFAMMTESGASGYQEVRPGGKIGPFKLVSFNRREFELEWQGQIIHKRVDESGGERPRQAAAKVEPITTNGVIPGMAAETPQPQPLPQQTANLGPGQQVTDTVRACQAGDTSAPGTISGGYAKVIKPNPLGSSSCFWTAVGK
jgi:hypothetical protein